MAENPLVGTWRLQSFEVRDDKGNVTFPMGSDAEGFITYAADGRMSVQFGSANRPRLADLDWLGASDAERSVASRGYFAYCGTYDVQDGTVSHYIELGLMPNLIGETLVRTVTFDGDTVALSTPPTPVEGRMQIATLVWRRV